MAQKKKGLVVMKFGGTSVQDSDSIKNVIKIAGKNPSNKIIVVSAISKATNSLEKIAHFASEGKVRESEKILNEIINRHFVIIDNLVKDKKLRAMASESILNFQIRIAELISGLAILKELSLRTLDAFRGFGELMSSTVIYYAMKNDGVDVELIDSREIIKTDN